MPIPANVTRLLFQAIGLGEQLRVLGFTAHERLSEPFRVEVEVACENNALEMKALIGKAGVLTIFDPADPRYFHGEIIQASTGAFGSKFASYTITLAPKFEYLQHRSGSRIFQDLSVPDILSKVFKEANIGAADFRLALNESYGPREYCVQYQETEFHFLSRLMEEEGLYYFFEHKLGGHVMVITDTLTTHKPIAGDKKLEYHFKTGAVPDKAAIYEFRGAKKVAVGKVTLRDYKFQNPTEILQAKDSAGKLTALEMYEYPGHYKEGGLGAHYSQVKREAFQAEENTVAGLSDCHRLVVGYRFELEKHGRGSFNREYILLETSQYGKQPQSLEEGASSGGYEYSVRFRAIPSDVQFRAPQRHAKTEMRGYLSAVVVGPPGEEIYTDKHGRIKVQFFWEREGQFNETSSCWLRVTQAGAGKQWGSLSLPRVGQEVMVHFMNGDPDHPVVTGRLYHAVNTLPYALPSHKTRTAFKTLSTPGGGGYNEFRIDDKKGSEQLFVHAEKDVDIRIKHDAKSWIGKNHHTVIENQYYEQIKEDDSLDVGGDLNTQVEKKLSLNIGQDFHQKTSMSSHTKTGMGLYLKAAGPLVIQGGMELTLKGGGGFVKLDASGVAIVGSMVKINSGGSAGKGQTPSLTAPAKVIEADKDKPGKLEKPHSPSKPHEPVKIPFGSGKGQEAKLEPPKSTSAKRRTKKRGTPYKPGEGPLDKAGAAVGEVFEAFEVEKLNEIKESVKDSLDEFGAEQQAKGNEAGVVAGGVAYALTEALFPTSALDLPGPGKLAKARKLGDGADAAGDVATKAPSRKRGKKSSPTQEAAPNTKTGTNDNNAPTQCNSKACTSGEPISMVTGEELLEQVDFTLAGPIPFSWKRTYRTANDHERGLGFGWTHPACESLSIVQPGVIKFTTEEGRYIEFNLPEVGGITENTAERIQLTRHLENGYTVQQKGQPEKVFFGADNYFRLVAIVDNLGNRLDFLYQNPNENIESSNQNVANGSGQNPELLQFIRTSWGKQLQLHYTESGLISAIEQRNHDDEEHQYSPLVQYHYDEHRDLVEISDPAGNSEKFAYKNHIITQRTLKTGFSFYFEWSEHNPQGKCTHQWGDRGIYDYHFEWDDEHKVSQAIDSNGGITSYHYDERGQILKEIDPEGGVTVNVYDELGQLVQTTNQNGDSHHYVYDESGNITTVLEPTGSSTKVTYNEFQQPTHITNNLGHAWRREYNAQGLLERVVNPEGGETRYEYSALGLPLRITNPANQTRELTWNEKAELIGERINGGDETVYDFNSQGQIKTVEQGTLGQTHYQYDLKGNITQIEYPDKSQIRLAYNANDQLTRYTDTAGRTTEYIYDGLAQVIKKIDPAGQTFEYLYDKERNLVGLVNEKGEHYALEYDKNERLVREIGFDGRTQQYHYDPAGYLKAHLEGLHGAPENESAHSTLFKRDAAGRLLEKQSPDGEISRFDYDSVGRLTRAENPAQNLQFEYSPLGRLIKEVQGNSVLQHQYNALGNRTETQLPNGETLKFSFNADGLFTGAHFNDQVLTQIERDTQGRETTRTQGALTASYDYDLMGRLERHQVSHQKTKQQVIARRYRYNQAGNLALIQDLTKGDTHYHYDALDRLKKVEGYSNEQFEFDPAGNLLTDNANDAAKGNRLSFQGDRHFTYDAAGNLTKENRGKGGKLETSYRYNAQNQLIEVQKKGQVTQYKYDALGRRIAKQDEFGETEFLWNGDVLLSEKRGSSEKLYVYEPDSFKPLAQIQDGEAYHYHLDHLGTPQEITSEAGRVVWSGRYKAYGNLALKDEEEIENNLRFQGQYYDVESGLHYNRHRYYDPNHGQFITQDPIGLLGGVSAYKYAPNPTGWVDPLGQVCKERYERYKAFKEEGLSAQDATALSRSKRTQDPDIESPINTHQIPDDYDLVEDLKVSITVEKNTLPGFIEETDSLYESIPGISKLLHPHEFLALRTYTGENYTSMNGVLRGNKPELAKDWEPVNDSASRALSKLASKSDRKYNGVVYRGTEMELSKVHERFPAVGEIYSDKGFSSTSDNSTVAFKGFFEGNVRITARSKSGVNVSDLSAVPSEGEVLFKPSTKFRITKKELMKDGKTWDINLEEIDG